MKTDGATRSGFQNRGRSFAGYRLGWETSKKFRKYNYQDQSHRYWSKKWKGGKTLVELPRFIIFVGIG